MILHTARRERINLGPSHARLSGYHGSLIASGPAIVNTRPIKGPSVGRLNRCAAEFSKGICARVSGHTEDHETREMMDARNKRRNDREAGRP